MAINTEMMIEWLGDLPDDAEIGVEADQRGQLNLIAFSVEETNTY